MNTSETTENPPIYEHLVKERGDVLAQSREVAEQTQRQARQALDFSGRQFPRPEGREDRPFSAFGERPRPGPGA